MKSLLSALFLFASLFVCAAADDVSVDVLYVPWHLQTKLPSEPKAPNESSSPADYPQIPNPISDYLPGSLYDVRGFFEPGAKLGDTSIAWFNPEAKILVLRGPKDEIDTAKTLLLSGSQDEPVNLRFRGEIVIQPSDGSDILPAKRSRWSVFTPSGSRATVSAGGAGGLSFVCEIEPVIDPDDRSVAYNMSLKVTEGGREYTATSSAHVPVGESHLLLLGTTPAGEEVQSRIAFDLQTLRQMSPLDDLAKKKWLLDGITDALNRRCRGEANRSEQ